ncbi:MAG: hypothetical protein CL800_09900 [Citromicrobium sp.]|uniref:Uncharacterized protein n=1 Tax=Aurantiacibacter xanthus TaxID=1784712 RepID=A0A3A1P293_9SPHN|nr:hypothetical protein [Sphingomonadaceae bacterium]MBV02683.1 hypothetical protein [Citromicrobium sp.]RIV82067.1 hypothetical protein D2V17_16075 [Aurantiacibacter xanthus]HAD16281.1 hypothetical protein [Erythrobacter sp.]
MGVKVGFLARFDGWIEQWAIRDEVVRKERAYWKQMLPHAAFWKLFGTFVFPSIQIVLALQYFAGDRAGTIFLFIIGSFFSSIFMWRYLVHLRSIRSEA